MLKCKPTDTEVQQVFDYVKATPGYCRKSDVEINLRMSRKIAARCLEILADRNLIIARCKGKHGMQFCINPKAADIVDANTVKVAGVRYFDVWAANHPLIGQVPYSVSQEGVEAVRNWLQEQDRRGVA